MACCCSAQTHNMRTFVQSKEAVGKQMAWKGLLYAGAFSSGSCAARRHRLCRGLVVQCSRDTNSAYTCRVLDSVTSITALAGVLSAAVAFTPLCALAVSGGGGLGTSLAGKDFSMQDLHSQKFYKADMRGSNFSKANLKGANLFGAFAKDAKFNGADLSNADVESVDFEGADLTDAILLGVQATNARFKETKLNNTDWTDAILRRDVQKQLCSVASGINPVTGADTRESLLC